MVSQGGSEAPTARHRHTTVLHDNAMWAYGGMTDLQEKSDFWRFDFGKYLTEAGAYPQLPTQPKFFDHFQTYTAIYYGPSELFREEK